MMSEQVASRASAASSSGSHGSSGAKVAKVLIPASRSRRTVRTRSGIGAQCGS